MTDLRNSKIYNPVEESKSGPLSTTLLKDRERVHLFVWQKGLVDRRDFTWVGEPIRWEKPYSYLILF